MISLLGNFYQMGFVARDLDRATAALTERFGITRFRRKSASPWMDSAHAWIDNAMIEVISIRDGAPPIYHDYVPEEPAAIRLHHHGYRVPDQAAWDAIVEQVERIGYDTPMKGAVMNGDLNYMYVDTRADLGIYSEFVFLKGSATTLYDDVPRN